jgi:hypothetical protein
MWAARWCCEVLRGTPDGTGCPGGCPAWWNDQGEELFILFILHPGSLIEFIYIFFFTIKVELVDSVRWYIIWLKLHHLPPISY